MTKGEAVEYVKVCSTFGPGFFYIPGTDTGLKIGGEIRADYRVFGHSSDAPAGLTGPGLGDFTRNDDRTAFNTQARIWFDARTQTDYGLLRSYFQINADSHPINGSPAADAVDAASRGTSNKFSIDKAFIQFGGLTAGYAHSFFGFYDNEYGDTIWAPYYAESSTVNLIAYTAQFGGGFSATLSIEDGRDHRVDNFSSGIALPFEGGQQVPDIVGQLRYDADWGAFAIQGALHQLRSGEDIVVTAPTTPPASVTIGVPHENKWGYAVGATGLVKLPFIDGGHFIVEGQYADGATQYLGVGNSQPGIFGNSDLYPTALGAIAFLNYDTTKGWSIVAELGGNITPVLNANLVGSYIDTKYDNLLGSFGDLSLKEYTIAGNLTYTIVKGLTVAGEVTYTQQTQDVLSVSFKEDIWQGGIRLKRVF
ncbi:porin [Labrys miyagiensis]|uniref:Porin n=2 Tax=Labrys miyagiensis TaxID=346912 RepID=A0ABQ6CN73_9HYPH|nr:porin [Labrys miyagiensis]